MRNLKKKFQFRIHLKSKHLLVIMTFFCGSAVVATLASGITSAPLQEAAGMIVVPFEKSITTIGLWLTDINKSFQEKQNLIWMNRMIESRLAVAQQLTETAAIMETVANDLYDISAAEPEFQEELKKNLRRKHVILKAAWVMDKVEGRRQIFLTMRARSGQCVAVSEISQILSGICECTMTSAQGSRCIVNRDFHTVHFVEDVSYQMLYGVAKLTREKEKVSGDNYICRQEDGGKL